MHKGFDSFGAYFRKYASFFARQGEFPAGEERAPWGEAMSHAKDFAPCSFQERAPWGEAKKIITRDGMKEEETCLFLKEQQ